MHIVDLIIKKRDGYELTKEEIKWLIDSYTNSTITDYQMSAMLMAIYFRNMTDREATNLALSMRDSGDIFDLSKIEGIKVDKHSTGGVGDKVTLVLSPLLAYHGASVAKMSGRGLGHTGGTLDKLESIPGFKIERTLDDFFRQVNEIGVSVIGQTGDITPADKKLYALRDVTGTIDSIPLIASSIMSKKLASGSDVICLDVKVGAGAFMKTVEDARKLATLMVEIGRLAGKEMTAVLTNMNEPLGHKIGNGLEVYEAIETLQGNGPRDLVEVTAIIGAHLLVDAKIEEDFDLAKEKLIHTLDNGLSYPKFIEMIKYQEGDISYLEDKEKLISKKTVPYYAIDSGYIVDMDALSIGMAAMRLGAGREVITDVLDMGVGIDLHKKIGSKVEKGDLLATLYVSDKGVDEALKLLDGAFIYGNEKIELPLIIDTIK